MHVYDKMLLQVIWSGNKSSLDMQRKLKEYDSKLSKLYPPNASQ